MPLQCARCITGECKCDLGPIRKQMFKYGETWKHSFPENDPDGREARRWHRRNPHPGVTIILGTLHCAECAVNLYGVTLAREEGNPDG